MNASGLIGLFVTPTVSGVWQVKSPVKPSDSCCFMILCISMLHDPASGLRARSGRAASMKAATLPWVLLGTAVVRFGVAGAGSTGRCPPWAASPTAREIGRRKVAVADSALVLRFAGLTAARLQPVTAEALGGPFGIPRRETCG